MGRVYTVPINSVAATVAVDLWEITPADDKPVELLAINLVQTTDFGDAQAEVIPLRVVRGHTTSGSGGSAPTPVVADPSGAAAGFTAETMNTTAASAGTTTTPFSDGWNVQIPYYHVWLEGARPKANQGNTTIVVRLGAAPADSITISGTLTVLEH